MSHFGGVGHSAPATGWFLIQFLCSIPRRRREDHSSVPITAPFSTKAGFRHPKGRSAAKDGVAVDGFPCRALLF